MKTKLEDLPQIITNTSEKKDDIQIVTVKRLFTRDGFFPAHFKKPIGAEMRIKISSICIGIVINPANNAEVKKATVDVVDENGAFIDWEFVDIVTD